MLVIVRSRYLVRQQNKLVGSLTGRQKIISMQFYIAGIIPCTWDNYSLVSRGLWYKAASYDMVRDN